MKATLSLNDSCIHVQGEGVAIRFAETPDVEFCNVTYAYRPKDEPVLQHFTCRIPAGSMVAVTHHAAVIQACDQQIVL